MSTSLPLKLAIGLLMVVSIIELSFISATVAWLHLTASGTFPVRANGSIFNLAGKPANLMVDQGHTSNGAAGTAFVVIGTGGILALWLRSRFPASRLGAAFYQLWFAFNIPALLLTLGALAYVFAVTNAHKGQRIDVGVAKALNGANYPNDTWTPQNWFSAVLKLDIADGNVRADILSHYRVMLGWQYNLIPFFIVQLVETVLATLDFLKFRRESAYNHEVSALKA